jgi:hypothetical protein
MAWIGDMQHESNKNAQPLTSYFCARSLCASASTFASFTGGLSFFVFAAADAHSGARLLQWPHHGA